MLKEYSKYHQIDGIDILKDNRYHQIMSSRHSQKRGGPLTLWIDLKGCVPPGNKKETKEDCYRVDFFPDSKATTILDLGLRTKGRIIVGEREMDVSYIVSRDNAASIVFDPQK